MENKLVNSELKVMKILWREGDTPARQVAQTLTAEQGWNVNTTYTLIRRCIKKGAIERREPNFICHALISQVQVQEAETSTLIDRVYDGSVELLFSALLDREKLSPTQIQRLKSMVEELE